jgi:hypothetical protein
LRNSRDRARGAANRSQNTRETLLARRLLEVSVMETARCRTLLAALSLSLALVTGCGGAQLRASRSSIAIVRQGDYSGELALVGTTMSSHYAAEDAMIAHCGGRVRFASADEAARLAVADPGEASKADDTTLLSPSVERVFYVCVTREAAATR